MDQRVQMAQKESCNVLSDLLSDSPTMSEQANKTPVNPFNSQSADGISPGVEITKTTSSNGGVDIQSPPITHLPNYPSSDSADGIPREDECTITNSSDGGLDIGIRNLVVHSPHHPNLDMQVRANSVYHSGTGNPNNVTLMLVCTDKSTTGNNPFFLDTGANINATGNRKLISRYTADKAGFRVKMASGSSLWSHGRGSVVTENYTLPSVHFVPGLVTNVVSVSELNDLDYSLEFTRKGCIIKDGRTDNIVGEGTRDVSGLFVLDSLRVPLDRIGCVISSEAPN